MEKNDATFQFAQEEKAVDHLENIEPWTFLIVDDEPEVHHATEFSFRDVTIFNRPITLLNAYSASEGAEILKEHPNVEIVFLDVIMETDNAGLELVKTIREQLKLWKPRIILRTGQPGLTPVIDTITRYDINDYVTKSELTRSRLLTIVIASLRAWLQLDKIETNRLRLEKMIHYSGELIGKSVLEDFAEGVISQIAGFLSLRPEGIFCAEETHDESNDHDIDLRHCRIVAAAGQFKPLINRTLVAVRDKSILNDLYKAYRLGQPHITPRSLTLFFREPSAGKRYAVWIRLSGTIHPPDSGLLNLFGSNIILAIRNIELVDRLKRQAWEDSLLGLPNLAAFHQHISQLKNQSGTWIVAVQDVDRFSQINDTFGHEYGNMLLQAIVEHNGGILNPRVFISRISADVFAFIGPEETLTNRILDQLTKAHLVIEKTEHYVTFCVGSVRINPQNDEREALKNASLALKRAKSEGIGTRIEYSEAIGMEIRNRIRLLTDLQAAFDKKQLFLVFQPQFRISDKKVVGFEALIRWRIEDGSFISPEIFIPLAEQSGIMSDLGLWIIHQALNAHRKIRDSGHPGLKMAINVSPMQLSEPACLTQLDEALEEMKISPEEIELEITESVAIIGTERILSLFNAIRSRRISLAVDDFGTGYSSLGSVDQWPIDRLKIDKTFIQKIGEGKNDTRIIEMIIPMAKKLSLITLAEGVETEEQFLRLKELGCDEIQGFLLGKPMVLPDLLEWMNKDVVEQ